MTVRPSRAELRHSLLARLATYTEQIEWVGEAANLAYADSVIAWADWLANTLDKPIPTHGPGARRQSIDECKAAAVRAVQAAKERGGRK